MAANFKINQEVKVNVQIPQGPVKQLSVNQSGDIQYLVSWVDHNGVAQETWFTEEALIAV